MRSSTLPSLALLAALVALAPRAAADELYVDALHGSDANTGRSPDDAWRTLTFALAHLPAVYPHTLHVAPGVYDAAGGEQFPLELRAGVSLVGAGAASVIDGGGAAVALVRWRGVAPFGVLLPSELASLELRRARTGVLGDLAVDHGYRASLRALSIVDMSARGLDLRTAFDQLDSERVEVLLSDVRLARCAEVGLRAEDRSSAEAPFAGLFVTLQGCELAHCGVGALATKPDGAGGHAQVLVVRSRLHENGAALVAEGYGTASAYDALVDRNGRGLVNASAQGATVVHNREVGFRVEAAHAPGSGWSATLSSSILHANGDDLDARQPLDARSNEIGDGDLAGTAGNFQADPLFVDAAQGDYRLRFGSPCVDRAPPALASASDLAGTPRPLDGDLDLVARADLGAYELAPLLHVGEAHVGGLLRLELCGPEGASALLLVARGRPLDPPQPTAAGGLALPRDKLVLAGVHATHATPSAIELALPADPALAGRVLSFQALFTKPGSEPGRPPQALSCVVAVTILP